MEQRQPSVLLPGFPHEEGPAPAIHLSFDSLDAFSPVAISRRVEGLRGKMQKRQLLAELRDKEQTADKGQQTKEEDGGQKTGDGGFLEPLEPGT